MTRPQHSETDGDTTPLYPKAARLRGLSYTSIMYVDIEKITVRVEDYGEQVEEDQTIPEVPIGQIPVMVKSHACRLDVLAQKKDFWDLGECEHDEGGYFIINGCEKVLIAQERMSNNHVYVFKQKEGAKYSYVTEIRSTKESISNFRPTSTLYVKMLPVGSKKGAGTIKITMPNVREDIPIGVLFRALGLISDREILQFICYDLSDNRMLELLRPSIEEAAPVQTRSVAENYIANRGKAGIGVLKEERIKYAKALLREVRIELLLLTVKHLLPHVGTSANQERKKAYFLGYIVHKMLQTVLGRRTEDDRDHYANKRLDLAGPLMASLFRQLFYKVTKKMKAQLQKQLNDGDGQMNITKAIDHHQISNGLKYSLATGNWAANRGATTKTGVSQVLNRLTFMSTLSHLRRLNTPIGRESKLAKPRQLHNTHWGMVCPAETPEGGMCGLVKNLSLMTYITVASTSESITEKIYDFIADRHTEELSHIQPSQIPDSTKVILNGTWVAVNHRPHELVDFLRKERRADFRRGVLSETSIVHDISEKEIRIYTDAGRVCRPLYIVENGQLKFSREHISKLQNSGEEIEPYTWSDLLIDGVVEYIDTEEEESVMIAMEFDELTRRAGNRVWLLFL
jgi:DNA-directed RNA polymerase II subunit RPB2